MKLPGNSANRIQSAEQAAILRLKSRIVRQGILALLAVCATVLLIFAGTAAWYTNVAETKTLSVKTTAWGFDGSVELTDENETMYIAPGEDEALGMRITNNGTSMMDAGVTVDKGKTAADDRSMTGLTDEAKKRIYFYADTTASRNGELMQQVWLNSTQSYNYTLLSNDVLTLTEDNANEVQLRYHWVYDLEGYYFRGKVEVNVTGEGENQTVTATETAEEYLRPVEYDYEKATFNETTGTLQTVDGKSREAFLYELTSHDGYLGTVTTTNTESNELQERSVIETSDGMLYYLIEAGKSDGEGGTTDAVYLCLYSKKKIDDATVWDTNWGKQAGENPVAVQSLEENGDTTQTDKSLLGSVTVTVTGQQKIQNEERVSTQQDLENAVKEGSDANKIVLTQDLETKSTLVVAPGKRVTLDLNGKTLFLNAYDNALLVQEGGELVLTNGKLMAVGSDGGNSSNGIAVTSGSLLMDNMIVDKVAYGLIVQDTTTSDSHIRLRNCQFTTEQSGILLRGNGPATEEKSTLTMESVIIDSGYVGVIGDGTAKTDGSGTWGTSIIMKDCVIKGYWAGVYQPQQKSDTTIQSSTITGYTGIALKGGTLTIEDSKVSGTGAKQDPKLTNAGFTDTGAGISVETGSNMTEETGVGYNWSRNLIVKGSSTITSTYSSPVVVYDANDIKTRIELQGGTYSADVSALLGQGYVCAEDESNKGYYTVKPGTSQVELTDSEDAEGNTTREPSVTVATPTPEPNTTPTPQPSAEPTATATPTAAPTPTSTATPTPTPSPAASDSVQTQSAEQDAVQKAIADAAAQAAAEQAAYLAAVQAAQQAQQ